LTSFAVVKRFRESALLSGESFYSACRSPEIFVVPAKAGTQRLWLLMSALGEAESHWVPAFLAPQSRARPCALPACAGTTDSGTLNFKESFNIATELLRGISVDRFFPGRQCAKAEALFNSEAGQSMLL